MKKLSVFLTAFILCLAFALEADARRFGAKAGVNLTSLDFKSGTPAALGYSAGVTWQFDLPMGFAIQPDLIYHVKATNLAEVKKSFGLGYIELPVNVQWGLRFANKNIRIFAQASPFIGYAVSQTGTRPQDNVIYDEDGGILAEVSKAADKWLNVNRFSYGAGLGLGVQLWGIQLTAQYCWNFGNITKANTVTWKDFNDRNFGGYAMSLAVMFGKKKANK